jgi:cytochrome P450
MSSNRKTESSSRGPAGYPLIGHLPPFLYDKLGFLSRCAAIYGDVIKLKIGEPTFLMNNPEDIKHILIVNPDNYLKSPRMTSAGGKRLSGGGLLTSVGAAHLKQRRMMQPVFYRKTVETFSKTITEGIGQMLAQWTDRSELNLGREMMGLVQRNIVKSVLGSDVDNEMPALLDAITIRRLYMEHVFFSPFPEWIPSRIGWRYRTAMQRIDAIVYRAIHARRTRPADAEDLLSLLLLAKYDDGTGMTDQQVRDEAVTLFITGYETMGEALTWTSYLLSQHPDIEAKFFAEVDDVLGGRAPGAEDLPKLAYTGMILAESMRLFPPTWIFVRIAQQEDKLPSGAIIPAGSKIYLCPYVMHRRPRYFPDPERFNPERFTEAAKKERPQFSYFPFGGGARVCIGEHFAKMEGTLVLASIAQKFRLSLVPDQTIVPEPKMTLRPRGGIRMRVFRRSQG